MERYFEVPRDKWDKLPALRFDLSLMPADGVSDADGVPMVGFVQFEWLNMGDVMAFYPDDEKALAFMRARVSQWAKLGVQIVEYVEG